MGRKKKSEKVFNFTCVTLVSDARQWFEAHKMTNKKTLYDVINNQENIIKAIKTLEIHVKDIRTRQITLEAVFSEKADGINSLIISKLEISILLMEA